MTMVFKVYWTDSNNCVFSQDFTDMSLALALTQQKRADRHKFVTMVSECLDMVGGFGVSAVVDGMLPSGQPYDWKKRRR